VCAAYPRSHGAEWTLPPQLCQSVSAPRSFVSGGPPPAGGRCVERAPAIARQRRCGQRSVAVGECEYIYNIDYFRNQRTFRPAMPSRKESDTSGARIRELAILAVCGRVCSVFRDSGRQLHEANRAKEVSSCDSAERRPLRRRNVAWARKLLSA
jgi:hypothetical protein